MPRFYIPKNLTANLLNNVSVSLPDKVARHVQVLRYQPEDVIDLFDGSGMVYQAEIIAMGKKNVDVQLRDCKSISIESVLKITLLQSISSSERMDLTIQKSVELGVTKIQPILTERSSQRLQGERAMKKIERWQDIAISACEQCGRTVVPEVSPVTELSEVVGNISSDSLKLLMSLNQPVGLNEFALPQDDITLLIGPEGGLSNEEESLAIKHGFTAISLGPRILRTETASLAAIAAMQTLWGDFV